MQTKEIKSMVQNSYAEIAKNNNASGCCTGKACCGSTSSESMQVDYSLVEGYHPEADLALGCGIPTEVAAIEPGDTVIDLGAGAGNDVFVARRIVGENGHVIGVDMTPEMVVRALQNNQKLGYRNVEFLLNDIEDMTGIADGRADVVISNCVMNLVPNKERAFREVYRVLKSGGHFSISDVVTKGKLPEALITSAELYAGCVAGASELGSYLGILKSIGFKNIAVRRERRIDLPEGVLDQHLDATDKADFLSSGTGIYSVTVYAEKRDGGDCCESTENTCCGVRKPNDSKEGNGCCS